MTDVIEDRWRALLEHGEPEQREVDPESRLRMLIGVSPVGRPYFAVIVSQRPGLPDLTSAIEVTLRQRVSDGRWTLTLELQSNALTDAFLSLMSELAAKSAAAASERLALEIFLRTLDEWRELLNARAERLSEAGLRGLIAELWFGFESGAHGNSVPEAAQAWAGPLGAAQDFVFPPPGSTFEVKSLRPGRARVEISSELQLDGDGVRLAVVTVEEVSNSAGGITLPEFVASIRAKLKDGADRSEFNRRFARLSIDLDDPWYAVHAYDVRRLQVFGVSRQFPALKRSMLPAAISRTNYWIDIQYLPQFLVLDVSYPGQK